jgi:hypothetical protein
MGYIMSRSAADAILMHAFGGLTVLVQAAVPGTNYRQHRTYRDASGTEVDFMIGFVVVEAGVPG